MTTVPTTDEARAQVRRFLAACQSRPEDHLMTVATQASGFRDVTLTLSALRALIDEPDASGHEAGLDAARELAQWELGDRSWADVLVDAYRDPVETMRRLDAERSA